jgi:hypothetical protein
MDEPTPSPQPDVLQPESAPAAPMSEFDRLVGVLFDPKPAFADIAARPRWWVPILLLTVLTVVFVVLFAQRVGWEGVLRQQLASNSRFQQLSPEQQEQTLQQQMRFVPVVGYVQSVLSTVVFALILSGVFLFVFNVLGGSEIPFKKAFAVCSYGGLPLGVKAVVAGVIMFLKAPADFDITNPVASNLGAFLDPNSMPAWLVSVGTSVDIFSLWMLLLLATGFAAAGRRLRWGRAFGWVLATWIVWLVVKGVWSWIFS